LFEVEVLDTKPKISERHGSDPAKRDRKISGWGKGIGRLYLKTGASPDDNLSVGRGKVRDGDQRRARK